MGAPVRSDQARRVRSGSTIELGLRVRSWGGDGWWPRRQADAFEVGPDRGGLGQGGYDFHVPTAVGAFADIAMLLSIAHSEAH